MKKRKVTTKMKNIFKTSKCAIIAMLTFCLLFCISGTQVFAAMIGETTAATEEDIVVEFYKAIEAVEQSLK